MSVGKWEFLEEGSKMLDGGATNGRTVHRSLGGGEMNTGISSSSGVRRIGALLVAIVMSLAPATAMGSGLLIAGDGFGGVLEIVDHEVTVTVNNGIAVTEVTQVFQNKEDRQVEALYTFPVPRGASIANFSMWIKGKEMIGEVVEKKRAREIYNSYKRVNRDPGLLEQKDYKTFEMRIFPIAAKARQKVKVCYYQELDVDHDWATYVYPLATTTRKSIDQRVRGKFAITLRVKSQIPIVKMSSSSHGKQFVTARHNEGFWEASLESKGGNLNRDVVLAYNLSRPKTGLDAICSKESKDDGYFCMTLTAGKELARVNKGMDYVFLLDVSGSMADDGKLRLSRSSIAAFLDTLDGKDRFDVVSFNVQPNQLFGKLQAGEAKAKQRAHKFLESREARGGTVLSTAMQKAYSYRDKDRPLNVVILSDGMTEQGDRTVLLRMIRQRPGNSRVFCIGVGNDVNKPMLEQVAKDAGGLAAFISHSDNFKRQAELFRRKLTHPVATGVRISIDGGGVYDVEPAALGNLFHGTPLRLYGRYSKPGKADVTIHAEIAGRTITKKATLELPNVDDDNPEIERMWAWHRADRLLKDADRAGSRANVLEEVVRLGEAYSIVTEYTSFIVLENNAEYGRWKIARRNALRLERDRRKRAALRKKLDAERLTAATGLGPVAAVPKAKTPVAAARPAVQSRPASPQPRARRRSPRRIWPSSGGGGGGAVDPFIAVLGAGLIAAAFVGARRSGSNRRSGK
jgi:Ca-activated chloride channel homolog